MFKIRGRFVKDEKHLLRLGFKEIKGCHEFWDCLEKNGVYFLFRKKDSYEVHHICYLEGKSERKVRKIYEQLIKKGLIVRND